MRQDTQISLWKILFRTIGSIAVLVIVVYFSKNYLETELELLGKLFVEKFGLIGMFISVYLNDTLIVPMTPDVILSLLIIDGRHQVIGLALISIASVLGGLSGYKIGHKLNSLRLFQKLVHNYQEKGEALFRRFGVWAVVIAGLTPVPFSTICWLAGMFHMDWYKFSLATLSRIPRMIIWYFLIAGVWLNS
jgi:membrane protein YqaA with SNARE-associated domain